MEKGSIGMILNVRIPLRFIIILIESNNGHAIYVARYGLQVIEFVGFVGSLGFHQ